MADSFLTTEIVFGRIESHTRPFKILVTAKPSVSKSALDCELPNKVKVSHAIQQSR